MDTFISSFQVERETGFGKQQLRKWRQRFGFPPKEPSTDNKSAYSGETFERLLLIKRLLEAGYRPSEVVSTNYDGLLELVAGIQGSELNTVYDDTIKNLIEHIKRFDIEAFNAFLVELRAKRKLLDLIQNVLAPLMIFLGEAWNRGEIDIYHEHLCTSCLERYLNGEILKFIPLSASPTILFAAPPKENHLLGLLMTEAVLAEQGVRAIHMGSHIPTHSLQTAAIACNADIVVLSFSFAYPSRYVQPILSQLRRSLPNHIQIWAGGAGLSNVKRQPKGITIFKNLESAVKALNNLTLTSS
jgi:methylmalonyl-CoA mutase cobalamin-binding subunit